MSPHESFVHTNSIFLKRRRTIQILFFHWTLVFKTFMVMYSAFSLKFSPLLMHAPWAVFSKCFQCFPQIRSSGWLEAPWLLWKIYFTFSWSLFEWIWRFLEPFMCRVLLLCYNALQISSYFSLPELWPLSSCKTAWQGLGPCQKCLQAKGWGDSRAEQDEHTLLVCISRFPNSGLPKPDFYGLFFVWQNVFISQKVSIFACVYSLDFSLINSLKMCLEYWV